MLDELQFIVMPDECSKAQESGTRRSTNGGLGSTTARTGHAGACSPELCRGSSPELCSPRRKTLRGSALRSSALRSSA
eukprot:9209820-Alexandrium_andersonii.AAC.1